MTIVTQYNQFACVGACLESIKKDWGDADFSHKDFISSNPSLFNGGTDIEGSCDFRKIGEIANLMDLEVELSNGSLSFNPADEAAILFVHWGDSESEKHCVRLSHIENGKAVVMNPLNPNRLDSIDPAWIKGAYKIKKPNKTVDIND